MKKLIKIILACILSFALGFIAFEIAYSVGVNDADDCIIVKGIWGDQYLSDYSYKNYTYCENCLRYSFFVQNYKFNYFAQNEHVLRDDLKSGDQIRIKLCWSDNVNGFLTRGVEKWQE